MAEKVRVEIEADGSQADKELGKINKGIDEIKDNTKGVGPAIESGTKATKKLAKGFKGMGLALKAAGIGIILEAYAKLKELFMQNQAVVDLFAVAFGTLEQLFSQTAAA
jgi:hypothetical protein